MTLNDTLLGCSHCGGSMERHGGLYRCIGCAHEWETEGRIIHNRRKGEAAAFDSLFEQMQTGNQDEEVRKFCYEEQTKLAVNMVRPGFVILDVGCGPELAYRKPSSTTVIGVDPSLPSLRANAELDLGIWGTAACLPIRSATIDVVFCFYSVHHMVGNTQAENRRIVSATFTELGRVVKGGGHIVVFDMSPWYLAWLFQRLSWNHVKRALGQKLDMYFWRENPLISHVGRHLPGSTVRTVTFASNPFSRFPPVFSAPWFRVPRFLYPMDPKTYIWTLS